MAEFVGEKNISQTEEDGSESSGNGTLLSDKHLLELYCPFNWKECRDNFSEIDLIERLKYELIMESHEWTVFCLSILLGCVQSSLKDEGAATTFYNCDKILEENMGEKFFVDIREGLEHVLHSCRLFFFWINRKYWKAEKVRPRIKPFRSLRNESRAAVFALKARILLCFGYDAKFKAYKFAKMAIELDPDNFGFRNGAWYCLAAKILAETRRSLSHSKIASDEELELIEKSQEIYPFPHNTICLADAYRAKGKLIGWYNYEHDAKNSCRRAKEIYEKFIHDKHASPDVLARCGIGLRKLPHEFRNYELAEKALERAMILGSRKATVRMGYIMRKKREYREALKHYEKASSEGDTKARLEVIKLKFKIDCNHDVVEDCEKNISRLEYVLEPRIRSELIAAFRLLKVEYLLVEKKDLLAAFSEWKIAKDELDDSKYMRNYKCQLNCYKDIPGIRLFSLIQKEVEEAYKKREISSTEMKFILKTLRECFLAIKK